MSPSDPTPPVVDLLGTGPGRAGFIERHALWRDAHYAAAAQAQRVIDEHGIELVRVCFADQHGLLRGKTLTREAFAAALRGGTTAPSSLLLKDTSGRSVYPVFDGPALGLAGLAGASDIVLVPDPTTFRVLPWAPRTGWVLCDVHLPGGAPVAFDTRRVLRGQLDGLALRGLQMVVGLEVEFHVLRPGGELLDGGGQLLLQDDVDPLDDLVQLLRDGLVALDLPLLSIEHEFGPSQLEVTFAPQPALRAADDMVLCRSAIKQLCRRHGLHATFMCRPAVDGLMSSGWHLHQSLTETDTGCNAFTGTGGLSEMGRGYLAGLLAHARGAAVFTTPTVNGYKRYRPNSLAPDRILWGEDNRGAMVRVAGDPPTHLENRSAEPAANPYLAIAAQIVSGMDGVDRGLDPGEPTDRPYADAADRLPASLMDALDALEADPLFAATLGRDVVGWIATLKRAEATRYLEAVTDWEQREYYDLL
jgi:glutamine synthetase